MSKDYRTELLNLYERLKSKEPFAFTKFADGELAILQGRPIGNREFSYMPSAANEASRQLLIDSFKYKDPRYYIGIISPDFGEHIFNWMKINSGQPEENLTYCDIFVNSNYETYKELFIPEYGTRNVVLVCSERAKVENLPFTPRKVFRVGHTALENSQGTIDEIKKFMGLRKWANSGALYLFCAGPFGNVLTHQLFDYNKSNTYMDIGSTIDPFMGLGNTRGYLQGSSDKNRVCWWK